MSLSLDLALQSLRGLFNAAHVAFPLAAMVEAQVVGDEEVDTLSGASHFGTSPAWALDADGGWPISAIRPVTLRGLIIPVGEA